MKIISKEQLNKLDALIAKYSIPEPFEETVLNIKMAMKKDIDVSPLKEERKKLITIEECKNIVKTASAFLNLPISVVDFKKFLRSYRDIFHFDNIYFMRPDHIREFARAHETYIGYDVFDVLRGEEDY